MAAEIYRPSPIKRHRVTNAEMVDRREALHDIVKEQQPMTVRQVFYQATVRGLIEKTEHGYRKIQQTLVDMRRDGSLPYGWITDNTRAGVRLRAYDSIQDALEATAEFYRRRLWSEADCYVEIWMEKDALAGVIEDITLEYDVPLMVARGYASLSFLYTRLRISCITISRPTSTISATSTRAASMLPRPSSATCANSPPVLEIHFERVAVNAAQINTGTFQLGQPSLPTPEPSHGRAANPSSSTPFGRTTCGNWSAASSSSTSTTSN